MITHFQALSPKSPSVPEKAGLKLEQIGASVLIYVPPLQLYAKEFRSTILYMKHSLNFRSSEAGGSGGCYGAPESK